MKKQKTTQSVVSGKRFEIGFHLLAQWLHLRQMGETLIPFFKDNLIGNVAIYGMGVLGERLYAELQSSEITVSYAIDRIAASKNKPGLTVYGLDKEILPEVDVIAVTPVQDYWTIVEQLEEKTNAPILSLKDIIDYCMDGS